MKVTASTDHPGGMTILIHDNAHQSKHVRKQTSGMPASKGKAIHCDEFIEVVFVLVLLIV
jgi:hypothetical protein